MSSDAVFWSPDPAAALPEAHDGLELFAPSSVDLAQRKTLPVVVRRKVPLTDDMRAPLQRFTTVIALDLAADEVFAGLLGPQREDPAAWVEPTAEQLAGVFPATTTQTLQADVRAALV